jgi:hypothetical protein
MLPGSDRQMSVNHFGPITHDFKAEAIGIFASGDNPTPSSEISSRTVSD